MPEGSRTPSENTVYSRSGAATSQPSQSHGARAGGQDLDFVQEEQRGHAAPGRQTRSPTTGLASPLKLGQALQLYGGQQHQPASGEPPSPGVTTSDVHGAHSCSSSFASTSSGAGTQPVKFQGSPMLDRYMTVGLEEPLQHEANIAIQGGWVKPGENMVDRKRVEEGWPSISESGVNENVTEGSATLGREE